MQIEEAGCDEPITIDLSRATVNRVRHRLRFEKVKRLAPVVPGCHTNTLNPIPSSPASPETPVDSVQAKAPSLQTSP